MMITELWCQSQPSLSLAGCNYVHDYKNSESHCFPNPLRLPHEANDNQGLCYIDSSLGPRVIMHIPLPLPPRQSESLIGSLATISTHVPVRSKTSRGMVKSKSRHICLLGSNEVRRGVGLVMHQRHATGERDLLNKREASVARKSLKGVHRDSSTASSSNFSHNNQKKTSTIMMMMSCVWLY